MPSSWWHHQAQSSKFRNTVSNSLRAMSVRTMPMSCDSFIYRMNNLSLISWPWGSGEAGCVSGMIQLFIWLRKACTLCCLWISLMYININIQISPHHKTLDTDCDAKLQQKHWWWKVGPLACHRCTKSKQWLINYTLYSNNYKKY